MADNNPIMARMRAENFRHFAECTFGHKNFGWQAVGYTAFLFIAGGWLPVGMVDFIEYLRGDWSLWSFNYQLVGSIAILIGFGYVIIKKQHTGEFTNALNKGGNTKSKTLHQRY